MEALSRPTITSIIKIYIMLTKPGIIIGNAITAMGGFILASKGNIDFYLLFFTLWGLAFIIASACVFNNYIDRGIDQKMIRTQNRPLVKQTISIQNALLYAICLGITGTFFLIRWTNFLTAGIALFGLAFYVLVYSFSKYRTTYATLIGSIAGAVPPVVGSCAVSPHLSLETLILFTMIALWQMPHFFAIAIYRLDDYAAASLPVLPIKKGIHVTKIHMLLYIAAFTVTSSLLTICGYTGKAYAMMTALLGSAWLWLGIKGFRCNNDQTWARQMFFLSLVIVIIVCAAIPFSLA